MVSESPAVARRRLRLTLRSLRDDRGLTQAAVADALGWSLSKLIRIELGEVTISRTDVLALLSHYDVVDDDVVHDLAEAARTSRQRDWWAQPEFRGHVTRATSQLLEFETAARVIRCFAPSIFPGLLQTPPYAAPIINFFRELPEETRAARLALRSRRYDHVFGRPNSPQYLLLVDESVIWRQIGGPQVLAGQLEWLLAELDKSHLRVRILPEEEPMMAAMLGGFIVVDLHSDDDGSNAVLYREKQTSDEVVHDPNEVARHRATFDDMWDTALEDEPSIRLIQARLAVLLTAIDRFERRARLGR
jgi:transcriptional regulator with XRE-family HTH domain